MKKLITLLLIATMFMFVVVETISRKAVGESNSSQHGPKAIQAAGIAK